MNRFTDTVGSIEPLLSEWQFVRYEWLSDG